MADDVTSQIDQFQTSVKTYVDRLDDSATEWLNNIERLAETGSITSDSLIKNGIISPDLPDVPSFYNQWKPGEANIVPGIDANWSDYLTALGPFVPKFVYDADYWLKSTVNRYDSQFLSDLQATCQDLLGQITSYSQNADGTFVVALGADSFSDLARAIYADQGKVGHLRGLRDSADASLRSQTAAFAARQFTSLGFSMPAAFSAGLVLSDDSAWMRVFVERGRELTRSLTDLMLKSIRGSIKTEFDIETIRAQATVEYSAAYRSAAMGEIEKRRLDMQMATANFNFSLEKYALKLREHESDETYTRYEKKTEISEALGEVDRDYEIAMATYNAIIYDLKRDIETAKSMTDVYKNSLVQAIDAHQAVAVASVEQTVSATP